jgi:hypothetical protein
MSRRSVLALLVVLVVVASAVYAYVSPYLTVTRVREAAIRGDAETVNAHVDFQALRESVKGWMGAVMAKEMATQDLRDNPFRAFGAALALTLADRMIDAIVTPEMVQTMLKGQPPRQAARAEDPAKPVPAAQGEADIQMRYEAIDRFVVTMRNRIRPDEEFSLVWRRDWLTWKLSALRLPIPTQRGSSQ